MGQKRKQSQKTREEKPVAAVKKAERASLNLELEQIKKIGEVFPGVVSDGKVNFEMLKAVLGGAIDSSAEKFSFTWAGKSGAIKNVLIPSKATLRPDKKESIDFDKTENIFIEGDNLEVLKLLQKSYFESIKMIYIDPPYNQGDDKIYKDDFRSSLHNYLIQTGQIGESGGLLETNPETSGRFHSTWLTMMYPRLKLAWNLLKEDGVIFISIDENEIHHLIIMMNEIFGEENLEGIICWRRRHNQPNDKTKMIGKVAEFIIAYAKNSKAFKSSGVGKVALTGDFSNPDNDPRGDWASKPWKVGSGQSGSFYKITSPTGKVFEEEWMGDKETFERLLKDKRIIFPKKGDGLPRKKYFKYEREEEGQCATNWWSHDAFGHNQGASDMLAELLGKKNIFDNPKPVELLEGLISIANVSSEDIVMDFFAGSGTTAQAVMQQNITFESKIKFLLVQLPELVDKGTKAYEAGYRKISEITKDRIVSCFSKIEKQQPKKISGKLNFGIKFFKLAESNYSDNQFEFDPEKTKSENETAFREYLGKIKQPDLFDSTKELDVIYENILKEGLSLNATISEAKIGKNKIHNISDGKSTLHVCLDSEIMDATVEELTKPTFKEQIFICRDSALNDSTKANLGLHLSLKTI